VIIQFELKSAGELGIAADVSVCEITPTDQYNFDGHSLGGASENGEVSEP